MSIILDTRAVVWTTTIKHPAVLRVVKTAFSPPIYNWSSYIDANGEMLASFPFDTPANYLSVGQISTGPNPEPSSDPAHTKAFYSSVIIPGTTTPITAMFKLGEGTYSRYTIGTLTITADCDVIADIDDLGPDNWSDTGFWQDMPNLTHTKLRLQLRSPATVSLSMVGNSTPYTGTIGATGDIFDNHLQVTANVKAIQTGVDADGELNIGITVGGVAGTYYGASTSPSYSNNHGEFSSGHVRAVATSAGVKSCKMAGSWSLERRGDLNVAVVNADGVGITADVAIPRYNDDAGITPVEATSGSYSEGIIQRAFTSSFTAQNLYGVELITAITTGYTNWGDFGVSLDNAWCEGEQPAMPTGWGVYSYLHDKDDRLLLHTWWRDNLVSIAQASSHDLLLGYRTAYTLTGGELVATTTTPVGKWSASAGTVELDGANNAILIKPPSGGCVLTRSIDLTSSQYGVSPSRPPRDAWAGYRWLKIGLTPVNPATGLDLTRTGDAIAVSVIQDDLSTLYPSPDVQTWDNAGLTTKTYTPSTVRPAGVTYIDVDLAMPSSPSSSADGGNPPATGNYSTDANPNVLSRYPQPTLDATHGGVTNAKALTLTLPGGVWWRLSGVSLHHATGNTPTVNLLPAYNQWVRSLRADKLNDEDVVEAKDWRRRSILTTNEGILGVEAFDLNRHSQYATDHHVFSFTDLTVDEVVAHFTAVQQLNLFPGTTTHKGAIRSYPGWSISLLASGSRTPIIDYLMSVGVHIGGRGLTWTGETPVVWSDKPIDDSLIVQGLSDSVDWFGECGDLFGLGGSGGSLPLRAGTVLRGVGEGLGVVADTYNLNAVGSATVIDYDNPDANGHLRLVGGHPQTDHEIHKASGAPVVTYDDAHTISWDYQAPGGSGITACIEAPCWWHSRGIHWMLLQGFTSDGAVAYAVSKTGRGARCVANNGTITTQIASDHLHAVWANVSTKAGERVAICWLGGSRDALRMVWADGGTVKAANSTDDGRNWSMAETVATGTTTACAILLCGLVLEAWIDGGAVKCRMTSPTGAVALAVTTVVASGADDGSLAVGERMHGGVMSMNVYYSSGGSVMRKSSIDGGHTWA